MTTLIIIIVLVLLPLIYLAFLPGNYVVEKSIIIEKDIKTIFQKIADLKTWQSWSPWLIHEPETKLEYSKGSMQKEGAFYSWDGKMIGAGKMTHISLQEPNKIEQKLDFIRPFKTTCKIGWLLEKEKKGVKVTWTMAGKMPFFFRFMLPKMKIEIGKDYEFGLAMLNGVLNKKADFPTVSFEKMPVIKESQNYLTKYFQSNLKNLPKEIGETLPALYQFAVKSSFQLVGAPLMIYYKLNPKNGNVNYEAALPVSGEGDTGEFKITTLPQEKYFRTTLKGDYSFLEMAWRQAYNHLKMKKMKLNWRSPSLEIYSNDPDEVKSKNDIITEIYIPIK